MPYIEPLGEEVLDKIYVCLIRDPEMVHPINRVIQFEDAQLVSDTTILACDNWVHGTYELMGWKLRGLVTKVTKACMVWHLGGT